MNFEIHHGDLKLKLFNKPNDLILLKEIFETGVYCTPNTRVFKAKHIIEIAGQLHDFNYALLVGQLRKINPEDDILMVEI